MVPKCNAKELEDDFEVEMRLEKAEQSVERKDAKRKKKHAKPIAIHRDTRFVSNPATGTTALSSMQPAYQVPRGPGMICCSSHCNAKDCSFCPLCC